ncbi:MAG: amidohydrolase, partial [Gemmatimonadetes bacterium]|nr:amidohydrolase [Gemmatimonadota bacterium]
QSSALLQAELREAGFEVQAGVAGMPTAFVATAGSAKPVISLLAEFDALPGFSQDAVPERSPIKGDVSGHACGHHLFGTASTSAAIAIREWLARSRTAGTIRVYGTPAEEGGAGKVYMVRAGLFADVDVVLHWHPDSTNDASPASSNANRSAKFRFHGESSHAAGSPERGRSALDGVEAMNHMVNLMREHVPQEARIHYVITSGGSAPNVVPDFAEVYYYVRHPDPPSLDEIWARVVKTAEGAALGTGTRVEHEVIHGVYSLLNNDTLSKLIDRELRAVGGVTYDAEERAFAERLQTTLPQPVSPLGTQSEIQPFRPQQRYGSTDVGDVSWTVPTAGPRIATWVPGTPAHSWQAVAAGGMSIGFKGMEVAAQTLARTAVALYRDPRIVREARREFDELRGPDFRYRALLGERAPPLDYRD